jgi:hypothetical protein
MERLAVGFGPIDLIDKMDRGYNVLCEAMS